MSISPARTLPILLLLVSALAAADETSTKSASTEELMQLEQLWNDAHLKGDADTLERLWSDDLQVIVPKMPLMRKADVLAFARSSRMKFDNYSTSEVQVRFYGDAAVVT